MDPATLLRKYGPQGFKLGQKMVYLPSHIITLIRPRPNDPPNFARFAVPLTFNKFDLRDYLWNVYQVKTTKVRSWLKQKPLSRRILKSGRWFRPQPEKFMMVEMDKPFVWPDVPEDLSPWNNQKFTAMRRTRPGQEGRTSGKGDDSGNGEEKEAESPTLKMARDLLHGK